MKVFIKCILVVIATCLLMGLSVPRKNVKTLFAKTIEVKAYVKEHNMNQKWAIFVDFSLSSGKFRGFLVNLEKESIVLSFPVAHGIPEGCNAFTPVKCSNEPGSNLSSVGKYRIGPKGFRTNGKPCFRVVGLEASNSNAYNRAILIHGNLPYYPLYPFRIPKGASKGCFTMPNAVMAIIEVIQDDSSPILLEAYL